MTKQEILDYLNQYRNAGNHIHREAMDAAIEAFEIADRFERADKISNREIRIKACKKYGCWEHECPYIERDMFCPDIAEIFFDGYEQALKDIRGDNND